MSSGLRPNLDDIRVKWELISAGGPLIGLEPEEALAVIRLIAACSSSMVWTYSPPGDGWLQLDAHTHRWAGLSSRKFKRVWKKVSHLFVESNNRIKPAEEWFTIAAGSRDIRPSIPASLRSFVMQRDAYRCVYCGNESGPFDLDHIVPYSRGGAHADAENLVCACASCNRRKKDRSPSEWVETVS